MNMRTTTSAKVVQVIKTESLRGDGEKDPIRQVEQYWSFEGKLLAEYDPAICKICGAKNCTSDHK